MKTMTVPTGSLVWCYQSKPKTYYYLQGCVWTSTASHRIFLLVELGRDFELQPWTAASAISPGSNPRPNLRTSTANVANVTILT